MKLLHCSDIHLGRRPVGGLGAFSRKRYEDYFAAFAWAVDTALEAGVDVVMITGDLFDRRELLPEALEGAEAQFRRLAAAGVHVVLTEGNHDNITVGGEGDSWLIYLENRGLLRRPSYRITESGHLFDPVTIGDLDFYGLGYPGALVDDVVLALAAHLEQHPASRDVVVMVHTAIASSDFLPGVVSREAIDALARHACYIGGGHFHSYGIYPAENPRFFVPGSLEYWDLGERPDGKGVIIYDAAAGRHQFRQSSPRNKVRITVRSGAESEERFREEFQQAVRPAIETPGEDLAFVDVVLEKAMYIDTLWCEEELVRAGALKGVVRVRYPGEQGDDTEVAQSGVEEAERELIAGWDIFGAQSARTARALESLKAHQRENNRDLFFETLDTLLDRFAGEAQQ